MFGVDNYYDPNSEIYSGTSGTITINAGTVISVPSGGYSIYNDTGTVIINGGQMTGSVNNTAGASFTMVAGAITRPSPNFVVVNNAGTFTMNGGGITGSVTNTGAFTITAGTITGDSGYYTVYNTGTFSKYGGTISGSTYGI